MRGMLDAACAKKYIYIYTITGPVPLSGKTHLRSMLQGPTTQLAKMSIDPKFVEVTADIVRIFLCSESYLYIHRIAHLQKREGGVSRSLRR